MIRSFKDGDTAQLFDDELVARFRAIERPARRKLLLLHRSRTLNDTTATKKLDPIPPGEILREEFMIPLGVSINALARDLDVPPNRISDIVNGKRSITADTALRLGKFFGVSPELWLGLQVDYELRKARGAAWKVAEPRVRVYRSE